MKISKSKQELAKIIHENGGWLAGNFASQQDDGEVWFSVSKPTWQTRCGTFNADYEGHFTIGHLIANRHQTILSRDEYFHLYPAPDADGWIEWSGGGCPCPFDSGVARRRDGTEMEFGKRNAYNWRHDESCPRGRQIVAYRPRKQEQAEPALEPAVEAKPTIEQLASDYRNAKDYADRKQQEADAAKADAEAKLAKLVAAGKALGLVLSVAEPELVITDWRDLRVGDEVEVECRAGVLTGFITEMEHNHYDGERPFRFQPVGYSPRWCTSPVFRFIRRPAKGDANA